MLEMPNIAMRTPPLARDAIVAFDAVDSEQHPIGFAFPLAQVKAVRALSMHGRKWIQVA